MIKYDVNIEKIDNNTYKLEIIEIHNRNTVKSISSYDNISLENLQQMCTKLRECVWKIYNENV